MKEEVKRWKVIRLLELFPEIDDEIRARRNIVEDLEQYYNPISAIRYGDSRKQITRETSKIAINIPDYIRKDIRRYEREIEGLKKVKVEILKEVSQLKLKQKKIIFGFYFHKMKWEQVAERVNYSDRQCKNIRDEALEKLVQSFSKNQVLAEYEIKE